MVVRDDGSINVNIGSPNNMCFAEHRHQDPCTILHHYAGIWKYRSDILGQTASEGERIATGMRHTVALASDLGVDRLYGVIHGRQYLTNYDGYTPSYDAANPAEEFVQINDGDDFGWPYCYYSMRLNRKVLAPEYGGNRHVQGRCELAKVPIIAFPAHWAPNGLLFYRGNQFPAYYEGAAFIAFHGSLYRPEGNQQGYNIVAAPLHGLHSVRKWFVFADGFAGQFRDEVMAEHRPVGLAEGPDGSIYVSDDVGGRIYRITYKGSTTRVLDQASTLLSVKHH